MRTRAGSKIRMEVAGISEQRHFVLVHGSCHGAWCWYKLAPLLESAGHRVTALDLGASGVNPKLLHEVKTFRDYVEPLMEFMASLPEDERVVLVGHSYGGLPVSLAMETFPEKILVAVFLTAYMPDYNSSPAFLVQEFFNRVTKESFLDCKFTYGKGLENPPTSAIFGPEYLKVKLYPHCTSQDLHLARVLVRPTGFFVDELSGKGMLTEEKYGSINRIFVICEKDVLMEEEFQRWMIEKCPPKQVKLLKGADHMIMLSNPNILFQCLEEILQSFCH